MSSPAAAPAPGDDALRAALAGYAASDAAREEVVAYSRLHFAAPDPATALPLPDEPAVAAWAEYAAEAEGEGAWPVLRRRLVQLRFPVAEGVSDTPAYAAATRRGVEPEGGDGLRLRDPAGVRLWLHPTPAGRIPVVLAPHRDDFVALVRALAHRSEPVPVPPSMGACIVGGLNNWDRVRRLRRAWEGDHPGAGEAAWQAHFRTLIPRKELYQDRVVLLGAGGYSAVAAADVGLPEAAWRETSLAIRLEHECAHYLTRRLLGSMRNTLHDELLADYAGVRAATGAFRRDWLLRFLGLEDAPRVRPGGRLANYRGTPPLSDDAFRLLAEVVVRAADTLERMDRHVGDWSDPVERARTLCRLAALSLPELALPDAAPWRMEIGLRAAPAGSGTDGTQTYVSAIKALA